MKKADLVYVVAQQKNLQRQQVEITIDALIDAIAICGPESYCREMLADWRAHGVDAALLNLPVGVPPELTEQFLRALAPSRA